jgi:hypothetical protein
LIKVLTHSPELFQLWRRLHEFIRGQKSSGKSEDDDGQLHIDRWAVGRLSHCLISASVTSPYDAGVVVELAALYPQSEFREK